MKLLLDQNLSHRLVAALLPHFPGSSHVRDHDLAAASDSAIWDFAKAEGYSITSKDEDFNQRTLLLGPPPKVIWLRLGNCSTQTVIDVLQQSADELQAFGDDAEQSLAVVTGAGVLRR